MNVEFMSFHFYVVETMVVCLFLSILTFMVIGAHDDYKGLLWWVLYFFIAITVICFALLVHNDISMYGIKP